MTPRALELSQELTACWATSGLVLHIGECAERIASVSEAEVVAKHKTITSLAEHLAKATNVMPLLIGRIGGQFAKSRSAPTETIGAETYPSYLGDLFNDPEWGSLARRIAPNRMQAGHDAATQIHQHLSGLRPEVFTSHELLVPAYEDLFDQRDDCQTSADLLWIGYRSKESDWPWQFASRIKNPLGVKLGLTHQPGDISRMSALLRCNVPKRPVVWIFRVGIQQWTGHGQALARAVSAQPGSNLILIDPMHGNTRRDGINKIRRMDEILDEVHIATSAMGKENIALHGLHLELHYEGHNEVVDGDLPRQKPICDPQLNVHQAKRVITEFLNSR